MIEYNNGDQITLCGAPLYATYDTKAVSEIKSGIFFIYNDAIRNDRIRITDDIDKVGKPCSCTGWINLGDIK